MGKNGFPHIKSLVIITSDAHDTASLTFGAGFTSVEVLTANGFETQEL